PCKMVNRSFSNVHERPKTLLYQGFVIFNLLDFPQAFALFQIICPFFALKSKNNHTPKLIGGVV
ncbi:hypothetical protein, partial [Staphylococcus aureus]|uniref:hypothetical protein n=1 Tax=Staphylococcus aureus TaxID=1280 RepID=UPI001C579C4F